MYVLNKINPKIIIYFSTLLFMMGFISVHANLPLYADSLGVSMADIGKMVAANPLASLFFSFPFAIIYDKYSKKFVIFSGLVLSVILYLILMLVSNPEWFTVAKFLEGMAMAAFLPAITAFISDLSSSKEQAKNVGALTAVINLSFIIAPICSAFIAHVYGLKYIFIFLLGLSLVNLVVSFLILTIKKPVSKQQIMLDDGNFMSKMPNYKVIIGIGFLALCLGYAHGLIDAIWSIYMKDCGAQIWLINLSYIIYAIPAVLISTYVGKWCDKTNNFSTPIIFGGLLFSLSQISYAFVPIPVILTLLVGIEGLGYAIFYPTSNTALIHASNEMYKGRALGMFNFLRMGGSFVGAILSAYLYAKSSMLPFIISAAFLSVSSFLAGKAVKSDKEKQVDPVPVYEN